MTLGEPTRWAPDLRRDLGQLVFTRIHEMALDANAVALFTRWANWLRIYVPDVVAATVSLRVLNVRRTEQRGRRRSS